MLGVLLALAAHDAAMSSLSAYVNWPSVRQKRSRYAAPASFYWTFLVFSVVATVIWGIGIWSEGSVAQDAGSAGLLTRDNDLEVLVKRGNIDRD